MLHVIASGKAGSRSPTAYTMLAAIVIELLLTFLLLLVVHGVTDRRAPAGLALLASGLALTPIHFISIPVDKTSVNPARSLAPAPFAGGWALSQLWLFIVFPIVGAVIAGLVCRYVLEVPKSARDKIEGSDEATE